MLENQKQQVLEQSKTLNNNTEAQLARVFDFEDILSVVFEGVGSGGG